MIYSEGTDIGACAKGARPGTGVRPLSWSTVVIAAKMRGLPLMSGGGSSADLLVGSGREGEGDEVGVTDG